MKKVYALDLQDQTQPIQVFCTLQDLVDYHDEHSNANFTVTELTVGEESSYIRSFVKVDCPKRKKGTK